MRRRRLSGNGPYPDRGLRWKPICLYLSICDSGPFSGAPDWVGGTRLWGPRSRWILPGFALTPSDKQPPFGLTLPSDPVCSDS